MCNWICKDFLSVADFSGHYMSLQYCKMQFAECSHGFRKVVLSETRLKVNKEKWKERELRGIKVEILFLAPLVKDIL